MAKKCRRLIYKHVLHNLARTPPHLYYFSINHQTACLYPKTACFYFVEKRWPPSPFVQAFSTHERPRGAAEHWLCKHYPTECWRSQKDGGALRPNRACLNMQQLKERLLQEQRASSGTGYSRREHIKRTSEENRVTCSSQTSLAGQEKHRESKRDRERACGTEGERDSTVIAVFH